MQKCNIVRYVNYCWQWIELCFIILPTYCFYGYSSHDNGRIVCGGADKIVLLMDVSTGMAIRKFRGHYGVSEIIDNSFE